MKVKSSFVCIMLLIALKSTSQELFVFAEPASNMPSKALGVRSSNMLQQSNTGKYYYHQMPEIMWGISPKLMLHLQSTFSNVANNSFIFNGASLYTKYRFYSEDDVHNHFRLSATAKMGYSNITTPSNEIDIGDNNTGAELGIIATKLINKTAINNALSIVCTNQNNQSTDQSCRT
jgi:hypothetical protein